jgi:transcriptional regulator with XRE-family HTH domain
MPADIARQFAANLRKARRRAGLSQEEVGWLASLHRTEISLLETGTRTPRIDTLVKLAAVLDVPVQCALLDGITWNPGSTQAGAFGSVPGPHLLDQEGCKALRRLFSWASGGRLWHGIAVRRPPVRTPGRPKVKTVVRC